MIKVGDQIPAVLGIDQNGREIKADDLKGRKTILYFYPKDQTPGCTAEACSLRDHYDDLRSRGYEVLGASVDSQSSHRRFIDKQSLPFDLISDTDHSLVEAFGVWAEKKMCGRTYMGTLRTTFVIDEEGKVERIFSPKEVKTKNHGEQLLEEL